MYHISTETFKAIYFAYFHSIMKCGRIWGLLGGRIHLTIKTYSVYKQKWFANKQTNLCKACFKHLDTSYDMSSDNCTFTLTPVLVTMPVN